MKHILSKAQHHALVVASQHPRGSIMAGIRAPAAAGDAVVEALDRRGFVEWDGFAPRINDAGRAAVNQIFREQEEAGDIVDQCRREEDERIL